MVDALATIEKAANDAAGIAPRTITTWEKEVKVFENGRIEGSGVCNKYKANQAVEPITPPSGSGAAATGSGVVLSSKKYTQAELEQVFATLTPGNSKNYLPGSVEHRADRWMQYKQSGGNWTYERWINTYNANMTKAREAHKAVDDYLDTQAWATKEMREFTINNIAIPNNPNATRRLDIGNPNIPRGVEVKSYETGIVYQSDHIRTEIEMDKALINQSGWAIEWVFIGCRPSAPLEAELIKAGIKPILK